ncbi:MAG: FAD:protein FMN transferase, partial [Nitrospira sp.]|nr:FAD:protein FMN transferase [Nitrospira sp.]
MKASRSNSFLIMVVLCFVSTIVAGCVATQPVSESVVSKRAQMHMGTLVTLTVVAPDTHVRDRAMRAGFDEVKRLEQLLSTWRSDSELSRVNAEAGRFPV